MTRLPALRLSTRSLLLGLWGYLSRRRHVQLGFLMLVMFASGSAELLSLGAILPFLAVLTNPQRLWQVPLIQNLASHVGFLGPDQLLVPSIAAFVFAAILTAVVRLTNLWLNGRIAAAIGSDLSSEVYKRTLYQSYKVHMQHNTSEVINAITYQVSRTVGGLNVFLQVATAAVVTLSLLCGLLIVDWKVALIAIGIFGAIYLMIASISQSRLRRNGEKISVASGQLLKALQEGLGAIRDVLLDGSQSTYLEIYRQSDRAQRQLQARNDFLGAFPRYMLEALGMVAIALLGGLLVLRHGIGGNVIPLLGALAMGAQRLLPALQQIYSGWAFLKSVNPDLEAVLTMLKQPFPTSAGSAEPMPLRQQIHLQNVHYSYDVGQPEILCGLDLEIRCGERIGIIGRTGSGKSTTVDLLMGLLEPTAGKLLVDGLDIHDPLHPERLQAWRGAIAHVPQTIFLTDSSIAENIAFGIPRHQIDLLRVQEAAQQAQISSFIESRSDGYSSLVGERGIRLSGGQRQRIGLARALYKKASVLVFDEATSALDNETERIVMEFIYRYDKKITMILVAHRLSALSSCDRVIRIHGGIGVEDPCVL